MREVVHTINSAITTRDRERELLTLRHAFNVSPLLTNECPGRALVRCGYLQKLCRNGYKRECVYVCVCIHASEYTFCNMCVCVCVCVMLI